MLLVPAVAAVALVAGCTSGGGTPEPTPTTNGVENLTADQILAAAVKAMSETESFRFEGAIGEPPLAFDLDFVYAGDDLEGTVTIAGFEANVRKVGVDLFVNAPAAVWVGLLSNVPLLSGATEEQINAVAAQLETAVWGKAPAALASGVLPVPLSPEDLLGPDAVPTPLTKGEQAVVNGTKVITFTDAEGSVFSVAIEGEPYLLQIETDGEVVTFSDFGETVNVTAPTNAVDLVTLLGQLSGG